MDSSIVNISDVKFDNPISQGIVPLNSVKFDQPQVKPQFDKPEFKAQHPTLYAGLKTASDMIPYAEYIDPDEREAFMKLKTGDQKTKLLWDTLNTELMLAFPRIIKGVGDIVSPLMEKYFPKTLEFMTKQRGLGKTPNEAKPILPEAKPVTTTQTKPVTQEVTTTPTPQKLMGDKERGSISGKELSPEQLAARERLIKDYEQMKKSAEKAGKDVAQFMREAGLNERAISYFLSLESGKKVPGVESKMAIRTEQAATDEGLTDKPFGNLAGYEKEESFMAKQESGARQIIAKDYNAAVQMAMGKTQPPAGVTAQSMYKYVEEEAIKKGDFDTIYKLGTESTVPSETSRLGQQIKSADVGTDESPLKAMQEIREARATMVERAGKKIDPAKQAEEISRLKAGLEATQKALDEHLAKVETKQVKSAKAIYGSRNKLVTQDEYLKVKADLRQQFSSQLNIGIDPTIIAKLGKIGAYHLEAGAREFGVWSERVLEDVGEWARPHLKEVWDNAQSDKKLQTYIKTRKTRLTNEERKFTERFNNRDFTVKEKTKIPEDDETRFLRAKRDQAKKQYQAAAKIGDITKDEAKKLVDLSKTALDAKEKVDVGGDDFMNNLLDYKKKSMAFDEYTNELKGDTRTPFQKANNYAVKWRRFLLLSSVKTLGKLTNAALSRFATTTAEDAMAGFWRKVPGVSKVFEKSPRFSSGFNAKATAKSFRQFVEKQTYKDIYTMGKEGKSSLGVMMGDTYGDRMPPSKLDFFGHLHGALKVLPHRAEFENSLERITEFEIKNGTNMESPIEQMRVCIEAMEHANRAILMRKNVATNMWTEFLNMLRRHGKGGEAGATVAQTQLPIVRVPTNYVAETANYALGLPKGIAQTMNVLLKDGALEALTREQADNIARSFVKGSIGAGVFLIGYYNDQNLGGYYQPGEKRKKSDVAWGGMKVGDREIPHWLLHIPLMEVAQLGATAHRVIRAKGSALTAAFRSSAGLASQVPFLEQPVRMGEALKNEKTASKFITELGASMVIPPDVSNVAQLMDEDKQGRTIKRKAKTPEDIIKLRIPRLREEVRRQ